jgi:hypothetical protein
VATPPPSSAAPVTVAGLAAIVAAVALFVASSALQRPAHVSRIDVQNPHEWHATVTVAGDDGRLLRLGRVRTGTERSFHEVLDQGDQWTFSFSYGGIRTSRSLTRAQLEEAGWAVAIPPDFADAVAATGRPPSPDR